MMRKRRSMNAALDLLSRDTGTHRMCIAAVGAEGQRDGRVKDAELSHHLLHAPDGALLVCVSKFYYQTGRGTLKEDTNGEDFSWHSLFTVYLVERSQCKQVCVVNFLLRT